MPTYRFVPPVQYRTHTIAGRLRAVLPYGVTVFRTVEGEWIESEYPTDEALRAANLVYRGGCEYFIDQAAADVLTAAGYGELLQTIPDPVDFGDIT